MTHTIRVVAVVAQLCLLKAAAAADCQGRPELCIEDETSLLQLRHSVASQAAPAPGAVDYKFDTSPVEEEQDATKAAQSNQNIQMYAQATARLDDAKALHAATLANMNAQGATMNEILAERAAADAVQAAQDEFDAVQEAVASMMDADQQAAIAEADYTEKHKATKTAANITANMTSIRVAVEAAMKNVQKHEQAAVNDVAAEETAKVSWASKWLAKDRVAQQKQAQATWKDKRQAARVAQKAAWKSRQKARQEAWKAHRKSLKAQKLAERAAAQNVHNIIEGYAPQPYNASNPGGESLLSKRSTIQEEKPGVAMESGKSAATGHAVSQSKSKSTDSGIITTVTTVTTTEEEVEETQSDSALFNMTKKLDEAISNEKQAKAQYDVARYAEKVSLRNKKTAQWKSDSAYRRTTSLRARAARLARASREALERAKQQAWKMNNVNTMNASVWRKALTAENVTYQTSDAARVGADGTTAAQAKLEASVAAAKGLNANTAADASQLDATTGAQDAMVSRIVAGYDQTYSDAAQVNFTQAQDTLTEANKEKSDAVASSNSALYEAEHAANEAQRYDRLSASAILSSEAAAVTGPEKQDDYVAEKDANILG